MTRPWVLLTTQHTFSGSRHIAHAPRAGNPNAALCGRDIRRGVQVTRADGEVIACKQCDALTEQAERRARAAGRDG